MSSYEQALLVLAAPGVVLAIYGLFLVRRLDRLDREIAQRKAASHAAE